MLRNVFLRLSSAGHPSHAPKFAAGIVMIAAFSVAPQAQAQFFFFDDYKKPRYRQTPPEPRQLKRAKRIDVAPAQSASAQAQSSKNANNPEAGVPAVPLYAVVSIDDQHVSIAARRAVAGKATLDPVRLSDRFIGNRVERVAATG